MTVEIHDTKQLGRLIRRARKAAGMTQIDLALAVGTGERFIVDLEFGKPTCQIGKMMKVMEHLKLTMTIEPPAGITQDDLERDTAQLAARRRRQAQSAP